MRNFSCIIIEECTEESIRLKDLITQTQNTEVVGTVANINDAINLLNTLEPNLLFASVKGDDLSIFKLLEKVKKQPTIVLIVDKTCINIATFKANGLNYLTKPVEEKDLKSLFTKLNQTHNQLAQKMQGLLGKLKLED